MSRIPTQDKCIEAFGEEKGTKIHQVLQSETLCDEYESVQRLFFQCFHCPSLANRKMYACNELLETHGIEGFAFEDFRHGFSYCNTGDTYAETICYDSEKDLFLISSWGDAYEAYEKEGKVDDGF